PVHDPRRLLLRIDPQRDGRAVSDYRCGREHAGNRCCARKRRARIVGGCSSMLRALTREISPAIERCELTHLSRAAIDVAAARRQHDNYERCLAQAGCTVVRLPAGPGDPGEDEMPDSVFVEDIAVVFDELAL